VRERLKRREMPDGAKCHKARSAIRREMPNGAQTARGAAFSWLVVWNARSSFAFRGLRAVGALFVISPYFVTWRRSAFLAVWHLA
jgi:hypothetical protein